jgi:hypothetical protein
MEFFPKYKPVREGNIPCVPKNIRRKNLGEVELYMRLHSMGFL